MPAIGVRRNVFAIAVFTRGSKEKARVNARAEVDGAQVVMPSKGEKSAGLVPARPRSLMPKGGETCGLTRVREVRKRKTPPRAGSRDLRETRGSPCGLLLTH